MYSMQEQGAAAAVLITAVVLPAAPELIEIIVSFTAEQ